MQMDGLYVLFDSQWQASEQIESALGKIEAVAAPLFDTLDDQSALLTDDHASQLTHFLALQACRHPDVMNRAHRRGKDLAELFADVHSISKADFGTKAATFGIPEIDSGAIYEQLMLRPADALFHEYEHVLSLSPQDPQLPATDALRALPLIAALLAAMKWTILHAPDGMYFILGDTPLAQSDLAGGYRVPLSRSTAITASVVPGLGQRISRRPATAADVAIINQEQWDNALSVAIGPNAELLRSLE
jgi:hypothetical protein